MSKQQTVVDWIVQQFNLQAYTPHIEQAKKIEKEQIIEAYIAGREYGCTHDCPETGEDYYNVNYIDK